MCKSKAHILKVKHKHTYLPYTMYNNKRSVSSEYFSFVMLKRYFFLLRTRYKTDVNVLGQYATLDLKHIKEKSYIMCTCTSCNVNCKIRLQ